MLNARYKRQLGPIPSQTSETLCLSLAWTLFVRSARRTCSAASVRMQGASTWNMNAGGRTHAHAQEATPPPAGKYTVPVLWDKKEGTIVNNESAEIVRMLNSSFNELAKKPDLDLCAPQRPCCNITCMLQLLLEHACKVLSDGPSETGEQATPSMSCMRIKDNMEP